MGIYDCRYRWKALVQKDLNWSVPDARFYNEAFTGRAKAIWWYPFCLQDKHDQNTCPQNPHRPFLGWLPQMGVWPMPVVPHPTVTQPMASREIYKGRCVKQQCCKYIHSCSTCNGPHPQLQCPTRPPAGLLLTMIRLLFSTSTFIQYLLPAHPTQSPQSSCKLLHPPLLVTFPSQKLMYLMLLLLHLTLLNPCESTRLDPKLPSVFSLSIIYLHNGACT